MLMIAEHIAPIADRFAQRAEAIFERYDFKWAGRTFDAPDYRPDKAEILNRTYHLMDCALKHLEEHPDSNSIRVSTGRIVVHIFRPREDSLVNDVHFSLDIL